MREGKRRFYVFHNEFLIETLVRRLPGKTVNQNGRAVQTAGRWHKSHLLKSVGESRAPYIVMDQRVSLVHLGLPLSFGGVRGANMTNNTYSPRQHTQPRRA